MGWKLFGASTDLQWERQVRSVATFDQSRGAALSVKVGCIGNILPHSREFPSNNHPVRASELCHWHEKLSLVFKIYGLRS